MPIEVTSIKSLLGDRILIRPLLRPEKRGGLFLPASQLKDKGKQTDVWFGEVEALGRDAKYPDAYGIKVGDVVGIEFIGRQCETLKSEDDEEHCWVSEEFIACVDEGRIKAHAKGVKWSGKAAGIRPIGAYVLVRPDPEEESRGGIKIPDSMREAQKQGEVIAVSEGELVGRELEALPVATGNRVLFGRYSGSWVRVDRELLLMKAGAGVSGDVIGVLETVGVAKQAANV